MFSFTSQSIQGKQYGRKLGFPTANFTLDGSLFPSPGVYSGSAIFRGEKYNALICVGQQPHFGNNTQGSGNIEAHLLNLEDRDYYGETFQVSLTTFMREMMRYNSDEELSRAIAEDVRNARFE